MTVSPCISICRTDPVTGYCYGCARSNEEKRIWKDPATTDEWKNKNLKEINFDGSYFRIASGHQVRKNFSSEN